MRLERETGRAKRKRKGKEGRVEGERDSRKKKRREG